MEYFFKFKPKSTLPPSFSKAADAEDVPNDQRFLKEEKTANAGNDASSGDVIVAPSEKPKKGLFGRKNKKADKDLELRLKMYELQLKLFEMQYLQGN